MLKERDCWSEGHRGANKVSGGDADGDVGCEHRPTDGREACGSAASRPRNSSVFAIALSGAALQRAAPARAGRRRTP